MVPEIAKHITYFGKPCVLACDAQCTKAWGINSRPRVEFDEDDDFAYLADAELGIAPDDPGTYEGWDGKPRTTAARLNKWCARECERSKIKDTLDDVVLNDWSQRVYNQPWKHQEASP